MAKQTILIVEDEDDIAELVGYHLKRDGYQVVRAATGEDALELVETKQPALVVLDLMLPGIDGLEVCKQIRGDAAMQHIAVLMLTRETGIPESYDFIVDLAKRHPAKPVLVSFTGDKRCMDECRELLEPRGVPTFMQIEGPFQALSILSRCAEVAKRV